MFKKVRAVGFEPTSISATGLKSVSLGHSDMLVNCGRNANITSLTLEVIALPLRYTRFSTPIHQQSSLSYIDEERIQLPIHTGSFRQRRRIQTSQNLPRLYSRIQRIQRSFHRKKWKEKNVQEEIIQERNGLHSQVPVYSWFVS